MQPMNIFIGACTIRAIDQLSGPRSSDISIEIINSITHNCASTSTLWLRSLIWCSGHFSKQFAHLAVNTRITPPCKAHS